MDTIKQAIGAGLLSAELPPWNADKIIASLDAAGYVIVPKEPTKEMLDVLGPEGIRCEPRIVRGVYADVYRAMIDAALQKPE